MNNNRLILFGLLLLSGSLIAQPVFLRTGAVTPQPNIRQAALDSFNQNAKRTNGQAFAVLQLDHIPSAKEQGLLQAAGIELLDYLPQNAYNISIRENLTAQVLKSVGATALFTLRPQQKMDVYFARGQMPSWAVTVPGTVDVWVSFPKTLDALIVKAELKKRNVEILSEIHLDYKILVLRIAAQRVAEIASLPFIEYVQPAPPKDQPLNNNSRSGSRANVLNAAASAGGYGLNGEGVAVGIGDNADLQSHIDFTGRTINRNASPFNAHGVHVSGTVAGAGIINELYRGYAPKATIISQSFSGVLDHAATYVTDYGMVLTNNSYGNIIDCEYNGTYDLYSRIMDQQAFDLPNLLHVFSAGNSGGNTCAPFPSGFHTVLGSYQSAKNVVTVGATNDSGALTGFSSRGPVKDGRLKPEIVAMGAGVISSWPTNIYSPNNGTSMSAPAVTGGLALLYQRYRQQNGGANPKNGLMKALLCNGAADRGAEGPDFSYGFGWMNLLRSVEAIDNVRYFSGNSTHGTTATHTITVPAGTAQLKVLLYWNDVPASLISTKTLVNDLDVTVQTPSASIVLPRILDTARTGLTATATTGVDRLNNIEQVVIDNPAAGIYIIRVAGSTVTNAQQEYFLVYDAVPVQLKLTAPAGAQALVPGETAKISWEATGLSGTANLEFSTDGGTTWSTIENNVNVARITYTWAVPAVATNNARVRITKNITGEVSVSNAFTILGAPVVSVSSVQCEGYMALQWSAVAGATDYEVYVLKGSEMVPVAVNTNTNFTLSGLAKDSTYFASVRARISGVGGRRSVAVSRTPSGGTCAGNISDGDVKIDEIVSPKSGRQFTSTQRTATETVSIRIKNLDDAPVSNFTVSYSIHGGAFVTETVTASVPAGNTYTHNFSTTANLSAAGTYTLKVVVSNTADAVLGNDTLTAFVKHIANAPIDLTSFFIDSLESAQPATYDRDTLGLTGIERYDLTSTTVFGRARSFVNSGIAYSGSKALTLDAERFLSGGNTNYLSGTYNLSGYNTTTNDLRLDFRYLHHRQTADPSNRVWIRGSDTQPWIEVFKLDSAKKDPGIYSKSSSIELSNFLAANGQTLTPGFGVRWGQFGRFQTTDKENGAGYTFDDIRLYEVFNDVQMQRITAPAENSCGLTSNTSITVSLRNPRNTTLTNVPVQYSINGGPFVNETIASLAPNSTVLYTFSTPANLLVPGTYLIRAVVNFSGDSFRENDTTSFTVHNSPIVSSFPYLQNFENGNGFLYTGGSKSSWEYGTPQSRTVRGAASGSKAWKTSLAGNYNDNELSYLYTPCFNVSGLSAPTLSFSISLDLEDCGSDLCDGAWVEYSADGETWTKLGTAGTGTNWYNKGAGQQVWSTQNYSYWHVATQALPVGLTRLQLRFVLATDPAVNREGIAIDDLHIYDNTAGIYEGASPSPVITNTVSGSGWIDFTSGGKLVASVQPQGQTMGATDVQAYLYNSAVRYINNQYYHNRNITIKPASNPADSVLVRYYFLDSETELLLKATGCANCTKTNSAYELGISQYTDADRTKENGTIADNSGGVWRFINPTGVTKVPFDKGYYAEFKVGAFSEFWLSNGGIDRNAPLPVKLLEFTAIKSAADVNLQWKAGSEQDVVRYEVEVAVGNAALATQTYQKIGERVVAGNTAGTRQYNFTDAEPGKSGARYYRLKIVNADGSFVYSGVRAVVFSDALVNRIYPNPSTGVFSVVYQYTSGETVVANVYDANGRLVKEYRSAANGFLQKLTIDVSANNYASGVYLLRISAGDTNHVFKLFKQ